MTAITHGESVGGRQTKEYCAWHNMLERCCNPRNPGYHNYGARGITVCDKWINSYEAFFEDVGRAPSPKHSLGRINNDLGYEPGNVEWQTRRSQCLNTRRTHILTVGGVTLPLAEWAKKLGLSQLTIHSRLRYGWTTEQAVTTPISPHIGRNTTVEIRGTTRKVSEVCREVGITPSAFYRRLRNGYTPEEALLKDLRKIRRHLPDGSFAPKPHD